MTEHLKDRLLAPLKDIPVNLGGVEDVRARATRFRRRRVIAFAVVALVVMIGVALPLAAMRSLFADGTPVPEGTSPTGARGPTSRLSAYGIELTTPADWNGRVYALEGHPRPTFRVASFALPAVDDGIGSAARERMGPSDVLLSVEEHTAVCPPCQGFLEGVPTSPLEESDFANAFRHDDAIVDGGALPPTREDVPADHAFVRRLFFSNGRYLELWVEFGSQTPTYAQQDSVNEILQSLAVSSFRVPEQPDGACDAFSLSNDPDCTENVWLEAILAETRFRLVRDSAEMTLYAQGDGASFFVLVDTLNADVPPEGWSLAARVGSTSVYGDDQGLVWIAQGRLIRIAPGPSGDDSLPGEAGLRDLVSASVEVAYPE